MRYLSLELEKLEQRFVPGALVLGGVGGSKTGTGSHSGGSHNSGGKSHDGHTGTGSQTKALKSHGSKTGTHSGSK